MPNLPRIQEGEIRKQLYKGKTILLYGARRVGKTSLVKKLVEEENGKYFNAELQEVREQLSTTNSARLADLIGTQKLIALDEVQSVPQIGTVLKVIHDTFPNVQIIATGSSSFEIMNATAEPLTGRSRMFILYPLSFEELKMAEGFTETYARIENMLRFGMYPEIRLGDEEEKKEELLNIASQYLYKDVLQLGGIRRPELIQEILKLLAFQIGHEVSLNELANKTRTSVHTIQRYIYLLENAYIIKALGSYSRNLRNELGKSRKYYFIDIGIRNAIINNFNTLTLRNDVGQMWENYCIMERIKKNEYARRKVSSYFWRTYDQKEIDYLEEENGVLSAFEFKWAEEKWKVPGQFAEAYPDASTKLITKKNVSEFF